MSLLDVYNLQANGEFRARVASAVAKASYDILNEGLPNSALYADATSGQKNVLVLNINNFWNGKVVVVSDNTHSEDSTITSMVVGSGTLTMANNLLYSYTVAGGGKVTFKDDNERKNWAESALEDPDTESTKMLWTVVQNATIQSSGLASTDNDIQFVVNSNVNYFAV